MVGLVKLLLLWYLQTNQNLKNYLLVLAKYLNNKYLNNRDIWYCENAICDKKGTYNIEIESDFHKKISNGLPFGIIFIAGNSDNPIDIDNKTKKLASCFRDDKNNCFIDYPITIEDYLILDNLKSCFVFQNKPNVTLFDNDENDRPFNLKQYLLGLKEKLGFELMGIFYCENANAHKIELIGNDSDFREVLLEFSENIPKAPNEIPQFLTNFKNSKIHNEKISFSPPKGLKSGKIIGKKIISNAFDLNASYCFITPDGLKNLKERLFIDIINVINQKKRVALNHAQIDDIQYNVLDSAFYFIFDVGNPSQLAIKVPRKSLENDELPNTKKNIFNGLIRTIYGCIDDENAFLELENDKTINDLNHQDLWDKLKTQAFPLSDIITNAINQKEGVALC